VHARLGHLIAPVLVLALAGCGGGHRRPAPRPAPPPSTAAAAPPPVAKPAAPSGIKGPGGGLAIGLTEANAALLDAPSIAVPTAVRAARDSLDALRPAYLRIDIDWAALAPRPGVAPRLDAPESGCQRGGPPCAAYQGVRDQLRAIASQQRAGAGFVPVIVIYGVPAWAAQPPSGCERTGTGPTSRPITAAGLAAYRDLISSLIALGQSEGVHLLWWSPWDEPNHPYFISPQRDACATGSPARAPGVYAELARALSAALAAAGGRRHIVLGDFADFPGPRPQAAGIGEFVADLPSDVVCRADVWAVHEYPRAGAAGGTPGGVRALERALDARGACGRRARVWVTETGGGNPHSGAHRAGSLLDLVNQCRLMNRALLTWYHDPRVDVAFQYSFREDSLFPVGLATPGLTALYPTYYLMRGWGGTRPPSAPPPALPPQCA
jgi:hypothetical protein